jgi:ribonuclease HI
MEKKYKEKIIVFTDGSCLKKKSGTLCGYACYFPYKELPNISRKFTHIPLTNQRAELYAIYKALHGITKNYDFKQLIIYSDSEYSIKSVTLWINTWKKNNWKTANKKPVMNLDIIKKIDDILQKYSDKIKFIHVMAHTLKSDFLSKSNEITDKLAKNGAFK